MHLHRSIRSACSLVVAFATLLTGLSIGLVLTTDPASATPAEDEKVFVALINRTRADQGLAPLTVHPELTNTARDWSSAMATSDKLSHGPNMEAGITANWTVLGENVGVHGIHNVEELFDAFLASPSHYRNLVDPRFNYVGVGVVHSSNGKLWTTHRFMAADSATIDPGLTEPETTKHDTPRNPSPPTTKPQTPVTDPTTSGPVSTKPTSTEATSSPTRPLAPPTTDATNPSTPARDTSSRPDAPSTSPSTSSSTSPTTDLPSVPTTASGPTDDAQNGATPTTTVDSTTANDPSSTGVGGNSNGSDSTASNDMTDLVQPDEQTVESVLIDLMLAGI